MKLIAVSSLVLALSASHCWGQLDPLGSGKQEIYPLQELPNDYVAVEISFVGENLRSLFQMSMYQSNIASPNEEQLKGITREMLMDLANTYWMPKDQMQGTSDFVIAYKLDLPAFPGRISTPTTNLKMRITYFKRSAITTITPLDEYSPAKLKELAKVPVKEVGTAADRAVTLSNLKQVSLGTIILTSDYDDLFPYVQSTPQLFEFILPYTKNKEILKTKNPMGGVFRFNMSLSGASSTEVERPAETPMYYESEAWSDGKRCVAFTDGHTKAVSADEWQKMQPLLNLKLKRFGKPIPVGANLPPQPPQQGKSATGSATGGKPPARKQG